MKAVIQRLLPLNVKYSLIGKKYIPILDSIGFTCEDCGKLISHIATVESDKRVYNIGFDCLEKLLLNNKLLCNFSIEDIKNYRQQLNKIIRFSKELTEILTANPKVTGLYFEPQTYTSDWYTYYLLFNHEKIGGYNMSKKIKGVTHKLIHTTIKQILTIPVYSTRQKPNI